MKPNIRVNRRGAVLPQTRGRFTPSMGQNGFIGAHFKCVITYVLVIQSFRDMCHTQSIYIPQHNYCTSMHRQVMDTKIHNFSLREAGLPQVTLRCASAANVNKDLQSVRHMREPLIFAVTWTRPRIYQYHVMYNEYYDACVCTGVVLLKGVTYVTGVYLCIVVA